MATSGNDTLIVQRGIMSGGSGDDTFIISGAQVDEDATITLSDSQGSNAIQFIDGLSVTGSVLASDTLQLTLSNGAVVTLLEASAFSFEVGGDPLQGTAGVTQAYETFATSTLGHESVPGSDDDAVEVTDTVTISSDSADTTDGGDDTTDGGDDTTDGGEDTTDGGDDTTDGGDDTTDGGDDTTDGADADTTAPVINSVSIPDTAMKVGDTVTVTMNISESGVTMTTGTINGVTLTGFTEEGGTEYAGYTYSADLTIDEGGTDRSASQTIPVSLTVTDAAGNASNAYTTPINQGNDAIDANAPGIAYVVPANNATAVADTTDILLVFDEDVTLGSGFIILNHLDGTAASRYFNVATDSSVTASSVNVVVNPDSTLATGQWAVHIEDTAIEDSAGNTFEGYLGSSTDYTFTIA